jgi:amino acid transporter
MLIRIVGTLVVLVFGVSCFLAVRGLLNTQEHADLLAFLVKGAGGSLDKAEWSFHWRLVGVAILVTDAVGMVAGFGLLARRRWSLVVLALVVFVSLCFDGWLVASGFARYAFEHTEPVEIAISCVVLVASIFGYWRWPQREAPRGDDS